MKLPHVVLKNTGDGSKVGDIVDGATIPNLKVLVEQGYLYAVPPTSSPRP